jgi:hypothetical protein
MNLVFDIAFDHGSWPGPLADSTAVAGERWVGMFGLTCELETELALGGTFHDALRTTERHGLSSI